MIDALFVTLFIVALLTRHSATMLFVGLSIAHELLFGHYDNERYYLTAAIFDYAIILLIKRTTFIQLVAFSSIILNLLGFILWFFYYEPNLYNNSFGLLYSITIILTIKGDTNGDVGHNHTNINRTDNHKHGRSFLAFNCHSEVRA